MSDQLKSVWPHYSEEEIAVVTKVLKSGKVNYWTGEEGRLFEKEFAEHCGTSYAVAVANGTVALELALVALGVGVGDEVVVTSRTFIASVSAVIMVGAKPVFADVDRDSQNVTADTVAVVLSEKTKAVIVVHLAGWPCDMDGIMSLADEYNLFVVEDCAQAHGACYKGRPVGSLGHVGCWSFCQDKIMSTGGEGGMVTTNESGLWSKMWSYKDHGKSLDAIYKQSHPPGFRWLHESFGTNWRMTEMQAAIGRVQLTLLSDWHKKRISNAQEIWRTAQGMDGLRVPTIPQEIKHAVYKCYLFVEPNALGEDWSRDRILHEIVERGVPCYTGTCSEVYLEKAFDGTGFRPDERLPVARELGANSLMFLVHPTLTDKEIDKTCSVLSEVMRQAVR